MGTLQPVDVRVALQRHFHLEETKDGVCRGPAVNQRT